MISEASRIENASANDRLAIGLRCGVMIQSMVGRPVFIFGATRRVKRTSTDVSFWIVGSPNRSLQQIENGWDAG